MRIVGGSWRGRSLVAPLGEGTRPTADRVRQALFDTLLHAGWGGRTILEDAVVLDVFAGTGALGLEALSRGAGRVLFFEQDQAAVRALRANIAKCGAEQRSAIVGGDVLRTTGLTPLDSFDSRPASLVFLDPPYGQDLVPAALTHLSQRGLIASNALAVAELGRDEMWRPEQPLLDRRTHGAAQVLIFRMSNDGVAS